MFALTRISMLCLIMTVSIIGFSDLALSADNQHQGSIPFRQGSASPLAESLSLRALPRLIVINELMASNNSTIEDPQGQYDDWIEIYNTGQNPINVGNMYLTDDLSVPTKWQFPNNSPSATTINAHGYLLIWADADNDAADSGLHTSFNLSATGDEVGLFDSNGISLIDSIVFGEQTADISYGRYPDANNNMQLMASPTPGSANHVGYIDVVADLEFSRRRGFYDAPFYVTLTTETEGAIIRYTLDGSEPYNYQAALPMGMVYSGPISISTTMCLRAMALKTGWKPTNITTHTYIFLEDVCRQATDPATGRQVTPPGYPASWGTAAGDYQVDPDVVDQNGKDKFGGLYARTIKDDLKSVPTISMVMDKDNWFGPTGIYINESQDGTERVCSMEWIDPNGQGGFQINCAIAMQGGADRTNPGSGTSLDRWKTFKLSMRPRFKTTTDDGKPTGGPTQLDYRVFPDSPIEHFDTFVLDEVLANAWNHSGQHTHTIYTQDQYVADLHNAMGGYSPHGLFAHLYINGLYWGMYYIHDRPDHSWAAQMFGGEKEEYDVLKHNTSTVVNNGIGGNATTNFNAMVSAANAIAADPTNQAQYDLLCQKLDIDNFITDLLAHWFALNWDWPGKNWYATHRNTPDGRWRFHVWDAEHAIEYWDSQNVLGQSVSGIHDKLKANAEYRMHFADLVHKFFFNSGVLTYPHTADMFHARMAEIDRAIVGESARWGDTRSATPHTRQDWVVIQDGILSKFIQPRSEFVLNWLKNAGLYPAVGAPVFYINGSYRHGGQIAINSQLSMTKPSGTIWYTVDNSDPRVPSSGSGNVSNITLVPENASKRVLVPAAAVSDAWRGGQAFNDSSWTAGSGGVGYETQTGYQSYFTINVQQQMYNKNATCYIRIPFTISGTQLAAIKSLTLNVRYDDGFIAYVNGVEVQRAQFTGTPLWNSQAGSTHDDTLAVSFESFDISGYISSLRQGDNILAIHGLNSPATSTDFLISVELVAGQGATSTIPAGVSPTAIEYKGPITLAKSTHIKSRVLSSGTWSALNEATFAVGPVAEKLRVTEIMCRPLESYDPNEEYIELKNIGTEAVNLNLVRFTNGINFTFPDIDLAGGQYIVVVKDTVAFTARYGTTVSIAGQYSGSLSDGGERIRVEDAVGQTILDFQYRDGWRNITDGGGFSLTIIDQANSDPNSWSRKDSWRASAFSGGSPGRDDAGIIPNPGSVVINELLANSPAGAADWIELYNTTGGSISIGGWFLSDSGSNLTKYRIADGITIAPHGYIVFYEDLHFSNTRDAGCRTPFALSGNGETVYLTSGQNGILTGYQETEDFGASQRGVSFGRYYKNSTDSFNFVAMRENTPGRVNAAPLVGPIVISEIMYNPLSGSQSEEYVELRNISSDAVILYDYSKDATWRFTNGIDYTFPVEPAVTIPAGGCLLVVKEPAAFNLAYDVIAAGVEVLGPYNGQLSNNGESIELSMPGEVDGLGGRFYIRMDLVNYSDGLHPENCPGGVDLWPTEADGGGLSLSRRVVTGYGNDVANWQAALPSPGR